MAAGRIGAAALCFAVGACVGAAAVALAVWVRARRQRAVEVSFRERFGSRLRSCALDEVQAWAKAAALPQKTGAAPPPGAAAAEPAPRLPRAAAALARPGPLAASVDLGAAAAPSDGRPVPIAAHRPARRRAASPPGGLDVSASVIIREETFWRPPPPQPEAAPAAAPAERSPEAALALLGGGAGAWPAKAPLAGAEALPPPPALPPSPASRSLELNPFATTEATREAHRTVVRDLLAAAEEGSVSCPVKLILPSV
jgi:hypothetical protein